MPTVPVMEPMAILMATGLRDTPMHTAPMELERLLAMAQGFPAPMELEHLETMVQGCLLRPITEASCGRVWVSASAEAEAWA